MRFPVTLDIQPSRRLRAAFVFVHLMAFFGLAGVLPVWSLGIVAPLLALSSWRACVAIRGVRLTLGSDGRVEWHPSAKASQAGEILADSTVFSWLTVLRVRLDGEQQVRSIVVDPEGGVLFGGTLAKSAEATEWSESFTAHKAAVPPAPREQNTFVIRECIPE